MESLLERAHRLLERNSRTGVRDGVRYTFSVPSARQYPFQWFWDSCFHAIVWSRIDPERAKEELRGLLAWQEPSGFVPHVIFWDQRRVRRLPVRFHFLESREFGMLVPGGSKPRTSAHMQPPVLAQAVERVVEASGDGAFRDEVLPSLGRYYRWLASARDPDGDGLVSIIAQFESGLDYSPAYDPVVGAVGAGPLEIMFRTRRPELENKLRGYDLPRIFRKSDHHQEDALVNAIHAQGLAALARLAGAAGDAGLSAWAEERSGLVTDALLQRSWDESAGLFWNLAGPDERPSRVVTVISLLPLVLPDLPAAVVERLVAHLRDPAAFAAPFPVPAVSLSEPAFVPGIRFRGRRLIWRGPLSMNTNWFLVHGLRLHGEHALADAIADSSRELVERGGFNEFYDPLTGDPVGEPEFGWATLAVDM